MLSHPALGQFNGARVLADRLQAIGKILVRDERVRMFAEVD